MKPNESSDGPIIPQKGMVVGAAEIAETVARLQKDLRFTESEGTLERDILNNHLKQLVARATEKLEAENKRLREDSDRLDWLDVTAILIRLAGGNTLDVSRMDTPIRVVIDKAQAEGL